jgi:lipopolysaccharide assembly outer membrane protein LptD (OstA)
MGVRLEYIITALIALVVTSFFLIKVEPVSREKSGNTRELAFGDTRLIEVDTQSMLGLAHSRYGEYAEKELKLYEIVYHTDMINFLRAEQAVYHGDCLELEGNVTLNQKEGFDYRAQRASYDKKNRILTIDSPFEAHLDENIITGTDLVYNLQEKSATGKRVKAVLYTLEK